MKTKIFKIFLIFVLFLPQVTVAATLSESYNKLYNPLPSQQLYCPTAACDLLTMMLLIIGDMLKLLPIVSVLFIIIGGFRMMMAGGNEERYIQAKKAVTWAVYGLIVGLMAFSIIAIVQNILAA